MPEPTCHLTIRLRIGLALKLVLIALTLPRVSVADDAKSEVSFRSVRLVLLEKCGACHGSKQKKASLDLSSFAGIAAGSESGEPLVARSLDDSLLWAMVESGEMPPAGKPQLSTSEVAQIRKWLKSGTAEREISAAGKRSLNQHDVIPITLLRCATCHGARLQQGGLDMRTPASMLQGGRSGPAFVPRNPDASRMIQRIESEACPPRDLLLKFFVRRPSHAEVKTLRDWISAGGPVESVQPDVATSEPDPLVSEDDRQHWAFRPPVASGKVASVDFFIRRKLKAAGLTFSPQADRDTLIRRAYFDLTGLPPSPAEWRKWKAHRSADWFADLVDELLESPRYGERWGRFWLDLAGYADSEGGVSADPLRKVAWKYRDYVIDAFNSDKPYDQFLIEQIAGDELLDHENASVVTPKMVENLVATGFLRMGIDQTGSRTMNFVPERLGVINDVITVVGSGLMGLTLECARCHSHKYDAIPQRDYYRFKSIFQGAFDEHDWLTFKNRVLNVGTPDQRRRVAETNPAIKAKIKKLESARRQLQDERRLQLLASHYPDQRESDRQATLKALRIADNNRSQTQRILVEKLQRVEVIDVQDQAVEVQAVQARLDAVESQIREATSQLEPPLTIRAVWDRGAPSPTYVLRRGEHDKPGILVGPGVPSVLTDGRTPFDVIAPFPSGTKKTGRRLALARWLTTKDHPLTARVMVNRIWYHHFGVGLVKTLENFGVMGERPSHPALLDWLAVRFIEQKWSIKQLHLTIMNSVAYQQSSSVTGLRRELDPENRLISRMPMRRMDAEALRDSLLFVSGQLDTNGGGPPDSIQVARSGQVRVRPNQDGRWRRSIYSQYRRTEIPTMMETFDYPEMGPNCLSRPISTVSPQSLMLLNDAHVRRLAMAKRVEQTVESDDWGALVEATYILALSRKPTENEKQIGVRALQKMAAVGEPTKEPVLGVFCHTILNSANFLYID